MDESTAALVRESLRQLGRGKGLASLAGATGKDATNLSTAARRYYSGVTKDISPKYVALIEKAAKASDKTVTLRAEVTLPRTKKEAEAGTAAPRTIDQSNIPLAEVWESGYDVYWDYFPDDAGEYVEAVHGISLA